EYKLIAADQFTIGLDVTLVYSLEQGTGYKAILKYGEGSGFEEKMRVNTEKVLTEVLGQLTTEDFFNPDKRSKQARKALDELNRRMQNPDTREYLTAHFLLIRNIAYDPNFEKRLLEKQVYDQQQVLYESQTRREAELEKTQMIEKDTAAKVLAIQEEMKQDIAVLGAQTDAEIARIQADAQYYAETVTAEATRHKREKTALGELEKTFAQARGDQAINAAYSGIGGQLLLVKKMIENVAFGDIEVNTNRTNPFDVNEMLRMLGGDEAALENIPAGAPAPATMGEKVPSLLDEVRARIAEEEAKYKDRAIRGEAVLDQPLPSFSAMAASAPVSAASRPASAEAAPAPDRGKTQNSLFPIPPAPAAP
ncbi:MAG: SPFH domain-containing protein, partial [Candidatus Sumerlaeota bacterium]|nr:SPFH domain-containing protein [Candidatus Sumerlaeota bacterium]